MTKPTADMTLGACVATWPATARVLEAQRLDYCCGGKQTIRSACHDSSIPLERLLDELEQAASAVASTIDSPAENTHTWAHASLTALCHHIVDTHHAYLRSELPRLAKLITKVHAVHGKSHPELADLATAFERLCEELMPHMMKEEQILFPAIETLEQSESPPRFPFGTVQNPIRMMEHEHEHAGDELAQIRQITQQFTRPKDACTTYLAMLDGLQELELNMYQHVHKENNILFARAVELEQTLRS